MASPGPTPAGRTRTAWWSAETEPLIEAAGRLCAVQFLAGVAGYTLPDRAEPDADYPYFAEVADAATTGAATVLGDEPVRGNVGGSWRRPPVAAGGEPLVSVAAP